MKIIYNPQERQKSENELDAILANLEVRHVIEITKYRNVRSNNQNRYYWAIVQTIGEEIGESREMVHELLTEKFAKREAEVMGEKITIKSTSMMDTLEFTNFIDNVLYFAENFLNLSIPRPEDLAYNDWINLN